MMMESSLSSITAFLHLGTWKWDEAPLFPPAPLDKLKNGLPMQALSVIVPSVKPAQCFIRLGRRGVRRV